MHPIVLEEGFFLIIVSSALVSYLESCVKLKQDAITELTPRRRSSVRDKKLTKKAEESRAQEIQLSQVLR